ncbi:hypothetical protein UFOVP231_37 [uncultured Caudovirales phage]|uniref:Uncharacterized protein n=1 Tax=uncultured Caudovirales phage TaxID=2100421 RepID=A0A6J7WY91_9CAUD|nr:hypothetical protein UFOVP231_37 [uncultured Caudovirales phage]
MTQGLSYDGLVTGTNSYKTQIATMAVVDEADPAYLTILPQMITYAENRMYRDLDFLFTSVASTSYSLAVGSRQISVPTSQFVVPEQINVITPAGTTNPDSGTRNPLLASTREYLDAVFGVASSTGLPQYFAPFGGNANSNWTFLVGPYPDDAYTVEIVGTYRPNSLGDGNNGTTTTTFISLYLPDIFIMASMIYISAYQRNFGRLNDDPQMAITYESQYQVLLKGAMTEEYRKKMEGAAWSSKSMSPVAAPTRG